MPKSSLFSAFTAAAIGALALMSPVPGLADETAAERISRLESETREHREDIRDITGGSTRRVAFGTIDQRAAELRGIIERLEEAATRAGANTAEIAKARDDMRATSIFEWTDIPQEGAEKGAEAVARRYLSTAAGRTLGALGIAMDVFEYGGRKVIKEINVSKLEELVKTHRVQHLEIVNLITAYWKELGALHDKRKRLTALYVVYDKTMLDLAEAYERQKPATSHANTRRDADTAGDREEQKAFDAEERRRRRASMKIETVDGPPAPAPKPGVHRADEPKKSTTRDSRHRKATKRTRDRIERAQAAQRDREQAAMIGQMIAIGVNGAMSSRHMGGSHQDGMYRNSRHGMRNSMDWR